MGRIVPQKTSDLKDLGDRIQNSQNLNHIKVILRDMLKEIVAIHDRQQRIISRIKRLEK